MNTATPSAAGRSRLLPMTRTINLFAMLLSLAWLAAVGLGISPRYDDFKTYRLGALDLLRTGDPYASAQGFINPPLFAVLMQPFALLSEETGRLAWFCLNVVLLLAFVALCVRLGGVAATRRYWGVTLLCVLVAPPTRLSLQLGQVSVLLSLLIVAVLVLERRPAWAGLLLATATLIKLYPAMLGFYYLRYRPRLLAWWAAATGLLILALETVLHGWLPWSSFFNQLKNNPYPLPYAAEFNISIVGFWRRLLTASDYAVPLADVPALATALIALSCLLVIVTCLWVGRGVTTVAGRQLVFCCWLCAMLLLSPINGYYNLLLLLLPGLLLTRYAQQQRNQRLLLWLLAAALLVCIPPTWTDEVPALRQALHIGWGVLLLTPSFYGLWLFLALCAVSARRCGVGTEQSRRVGEA